MGRMLFVIWAIVVTTAVTAINAGIRDDDGGSYRSWGSGNSYSGTGGFHK